MKKIKGTKYGYSMGSKMKERKGTRFIKEFKGGEVCVSMITFQDRVYVATNKHIYMMVNDKLEPLEIKEIPPDEKFFGREGKKHGTE